MSDENKKDELGQENLAYEVIEEKDVKSSNGLDIIELEKMNGTVEPEIESDKVEVKKAKPKKVNIFQLYKYADGLELLLMLIGVLCAIAQGATLQGPYVFMADTIDQYAASLNCSEYANVTNTTQEECQQILLDASLRVSVGVAICGAIIVINYYFHIFLFTIVADRLTRRIRLLAFSNILRQHVGYFDVHFGGELNTRLTQDITKKKKVPTATLR